MTGADILLAVVLVLTPVCSAALTHLLMSDKNAGKDKDHD